MEVIILIINIQNYNAKFNKKKFDSCLIIISKLYFTMGGWEGQGYPRVKSMVQFVQLEGGGAGQRGIPSLKTDYTVGTQKDFLVI